MTPLVARLAVAALCVVGVRAALLMEGKARRAAAGELDEPSVVQTPRAHLLGRLNNSTIGLVYYVVLFACSFFLQQPAVHAAALGASITAAAVSLYLAYSLLFVTRMPCVNCWTGHVVNWMLLAALVLARTAE